MRNLRAEQQVLAADFGIPAPARSTDRGAAAAASSISGRGWSGLRMPQGESEDRCITDAGLCMGRSCRVGWSPFGFYARAGEALACQHVLTLLCEILDGGTVMRKAAVCCLMD